MAKLIFFNYYKMNLEDCPADIQYYFFSWGYDNYIVVIVVEAGFELEAEVEVEVEDDILLDY